MNHELLSLHQTSNKDQEFQQKLLKQIRDAERQCQESQKKINSLCSVNEELRELISQERQCMDEVCSDFEQQISKIKKNEERRAKLHRNKLIMVLGNFMMDITIAKQFPDPVSRDASLGELIQRLDDVSGVFKSQENRP